MNSINETLASEIYRAIEGDKGTFSVEVETENGVMICADGSFEIDGYREDDYFNGTGAWVATYVSVRVETVEAYDEDGEPVEIDCDLSEIERSVEGDLAA